MLPGRLFDASRPLSKDEEFLNSSGEILGNLRSICKALELRLLSSTPRNLSICVELYRRIIRV